MDIVRSLGDGIVDILQQLINVKLLDKVLDDLLKKRKQEILTSIYVKVEENKAIKEETDNKRKYRIM